MEAQDAPAVIEGLTAFPGRGAGSDAERRAGNWLAAHCSDYIGEPDIETFWCRPNWALAHLWHVTLAVAGSLIALASPIAGMALLGIALISVLSDSLTGKSLGRRLTPERASQNIRVPAPSEDRTRLILTANYDAGRIGLAYRLRPMSGRLRNALGGLSPGWLGWLTIAIVWLLIVAVLRQEGHHSKLIGAIQLIPTVGLVLGFALLVELATGAWSPAANDNASGVAVVLQAAAGLLSAPPQHLDVEVLLTGAGDAEQIGLRRYLRTHRKRRAGGSSTVVLGVAASGGGTPHWWQSDGAFLPLRYARSMRRIAARLAADEAYLGAQPQRGRGNHTALPARVAGLPTLTIGGLDAAGAAPRSHLKTDLAGAIDPQAVERVASFALLLVDGIDAAVGEEQRRRAATPE